jgi:lipopolysaccharide export system protein LptA
MLTDWMQNHSARILFVNISFILTIRRTSMRLLTLFISFICAFCAASGAWCQEGKNPAAPIQIEADRMETSQEDGNVFFSGNVKANQGDLVIHADEMTVLYIKTGLQSNAPAGTAENLNQKIEKIMAKGNVKIVQGDWVAAGETMDFNADDRIVILAGNAKAWQDQNMVSGEKIILYLDEGKSVVESSSREGERVKAFIYPSAQEKNEAGNR